MHTDRSKLTPMRYTALNTTVTGSRGSNRQRSMQLRERVTKPDGEGTSWRRNLDKGREKVEKSTSEEQTGREIRRKDL